MTPLLEIIAAEGPNGRFLPADIKELFWAILAFMVIFAGFVTKGLPAIKAALEKGQEAAVAEATEAEARLARSNAMIAEKTAELGDANAQSERIIAEANDTAQQIRIDSANRTQQLVNDMWLKAQSDVDAMKVQATADIQAEVAAQAVGAAEQVVRNNLDAAGQSALVDNYITSLGAAS